MARPLKGTLVTTSLSDKIYNKSLQKYAQKEYLSAVLMQFVLIENNIRARLIGLCVQGNKLPVKLVEHLTQGVRFYRLVENFSKLIPDKKEWEDICVKMNDYRARRNRIIHELDSFRNFAELDRYIKETWGVGSEIFKFLCLN